MKTKFILHGGNSSKKSENNEKFFHEIINSVDSNEVKILCIYFARPEDRWEDSFDEDQTIFRCLDTPKELDIKMATLESEVLVEQIKNSDVIFINGGRKGCLKDVLLGLGNFAQLTQGKIVVGISAGASILCKYYHSSVTNGVREGVGILPAKVFTHWNNELTLELQELDSYKEKLPIYKIPEENFIVVE